MFGQGSGLFLLQLGGTRVGPAGLGKLLSRIGRGVGHSGKEAAVKTSTSVFVTIVLLLVGTSYVSSTPRLDEAMVEVAAGQASVGEAHLEYYRQHLARLGIERQNCK